MVHITEKKKPRSEVRRVSPGDPRLWVLAPGRDLLWGSHSVDLQWRARSLTSRHQGNTTLFLNFSPTQWWVMMEGSSSVVWSMVALFPGILTLLQGVWHPDALLIQQVICAPILVGTCTEKNNSPRWSDRYKHSARGAREQVISADSGGVDHITSGPENQNPPPSTSDISFNWRPQLICHKHFYWPKTEI